MEAAAAMRPRGSRAGGKSWLQAGCGSACARACCTASPPAARCIGCAMGHQGRALMRRSPLVRLMGSIRGQGCPGRVESDFLNKGF
eukprot:scaffold40384_cov62-Phaeocystis_antarctica.AAC.1